MHSPEPAKQPSHLYEKRKAVFPKAVDGRFRRFKWLVMALTLGVYYITPWLRWDRGPYAPNQAVLVDLAHRRFYMFSIEIWPQEFYFVAGLLIMAGIGLFLVTSAVGRAWCGYTCPQTVWTDLYQHVDRLIDGDRNAQMRLEAAPWTGKKIFKRGVKWAIYLLIAFWTGGAWIMYFADAPTLTVDFWTGKAAPVAYATVGVLTATTFLLGGFMREQVCVYMCPWPRIQTAMLDEKSLIVTYKDWRGEPRGSVKKAEKNPGSVGDCVDCDQCVAVCPTGYDIRNGPDIRCITCALCIDACDKVMTQLGRPRGLIDYATLEDCASERAGGTPRPITKALFHTRTLIYTAVWGAIGLGLLFALGSRSRIDIAVQKDRNPPFSQQSNGDIRNDYTVKLRNMEARPRPMEVTIEGLPGGMMWTDDLPRDKAARSLTVTVAADQVDPLRVYVVAPEGTAPQKFNFVLKAKDAEGGGDVSEVRFDAPGEEE
ncbi:MAG: cytochrome c oxidase accessory protein CcoG [Novosphingobium sp.]|uniref:cytochrome c oxidase accessory protein CcoG n=1 Tax=Novosphingobium sp. TaxID=1874826 RepID=UPI001D1BA535|nr:cytochrome c oxidase accessory protein CcoG [Novosphingobium sp.]MCB2058329.1 cytochrome c oxidase accessory protein CcoG [Novosphingobium sp.]MCP5385608.1 cytochrome c oxidase accessory protein CcoG [Novosphingobium sp.]